MPFGKNKNLKKIDFKIEKLDLFAQGVHRSDDKVCFIKGALPKEEGEAYLYKEAKGVRFARLGHLSNLKIKSPLRITPQCEHYFDCPGCHYQHVSYESELKFKLEALEYQVKKLFTGQINVIQAKERFYYRSRIQLHYNLKNKKLGLISAEENKIIQIPNCLIASAKIQDYLKDFYQTWTTLVPKNSPHSGHVELIEKDGLVKLAWNQAYAHLGFEQVYREQNLVLQELVFNLSQVEEFNLCLDLFGGSGNLSRKLDQFPCHIIDVFCREDQLSKHQKFLKLSLDDSPPIKARDEKTLFIVDPPRRGFKKINQWTAEHRPNFIIYISCNSSTFIRDLNSISYDIEKLYLLDFFPATHHFEVVALLKAK